MDEEPQGRTFVAIYHGATIASARLVGVTMDPETVAFAAERILAESLVQLKGDRITAMKEGGRQQALRQIIEDAEADM
jgi:hypothetical protein